MKCPLTKEDCYKNRCEWWSEKQSRCSIAVDESDSGCMILILNVLFIIFIIVYLLK